MRNMQDYWEEKVEQIANKLGWNVFERKEYANCGWWFFKKDNEPTRQIYFNFQNKSYSFRDGCGSIYDGVNCDYANDGEELQAIEYIKNKLK